MWWGGASKALYSSCDIVFCHVVIRPSLAETNLLFSIFFLFVSFLFVRFSPSSFLSFIIFPPFYVRLFFILFIFYFFLLTTQPPPATNL